MIVALVVGLLAISLPGTSTSSVQAAFPGANGKIVFSSTRVGSQHDVYVMNADGSGQTRLTDLAAHDLSPTWSPDGTKIAFASNRNQGQYEIYVMNADGSGQTRLTNLAGQDDEPAWSPDGSKIVFGGEAGLYVMDADGGNLIQLTSGNDNAPSWSSDGSKIAFTRTPNSFPPFGNSQVYLVNADGSNLTNVTNSGSSDGDPNWSPDGTKLVYVRVLADDNREIFVINANGSGRTRLTNRVGPDWMPAWSPDGTKIIYIRDGANGRFQVYMMNANGSNPVNLTNSAGHDYWPDWQATAAEEPVVGFTPTNDAYVLQGKPTKVFGTKPVLQVKDAAKDTVSYIKFNVNSVTGTIEQATLRLYVTDPGPDGGALYAVSSYYAGTSTFWLETGLNWNNAPTISGSPIAQFGKVKKNQWVEVDVTAAVIQAMAEENGRVSFAIRNSSTNLIKFSSKEGVKAPELIVTVQ